VEGLRSALAAGLTSRLVRRQMFNQSSNYGAEAAESATSLLLSFCLILSQVVPQSRHETSAAELLQGRAWEIQ
jgi:hypothetical protein